MLKIISYFFSMMYHEYLFQLYIYSMLPSFIGCIIVHPLTYKIYLTSSYSYLDDFQ